METQKNKVERKIEGLILERASTTSDAFLNMRDFLARIRAEYPTHRYPGSEAVESYDPERSQRVPIVYSAKVDNVTVGILMGIQEDLGFDAHVFIVDPKFRNTEVSRRLMELVQEDYDTIHLAPRPLQRELRPQFQDTYVRKEALIRWYQKFGFVEDDLGKMTWSRQQK